MLYEIGDPQAYMLPDVVCDFSTARIEQVSRDRVHVLGVIGRMAPDTYKVSATYADEFRGGTYMTFYGIDADKKARALGDAAFEAARKVFENAGLSDFSETSIELLGTETHYGAFSEITGSRETVMKIAVKHPDIAGIGIFLKEAVGLGLATPPGLSGFAGSRPSPSPVVRLFSYTMAKTQLQVQILVGDEVIFCNEAYGEPLDIKAICRPITPTADESTQMVKVPLIDLAWGRSGDKGDKANIGIIARKREYLPYICAAITEAVVRERFAHFLQDISEGSVDRYLLPASNAINFLLHDVLGGGGVASIRNDAQGKGYAQLLMSCPISVPTAIAEALL
jgi:hypothetical protein